MKKQVYMSIIRNEIPILEYDDDQEAVITPQSEDSDLILPQKAVFAFLGDAVDRYATEHNARVVRDFVTIAKVFHLYVLKVNNEEIALMQSPVGAPAATQFLDYLIGHGVKKIIATGSCGSLEDIEENSFLIPYKALRDEGTSYHYLPAARFIEISAEARNAIKKTLDDHGLKYKEVITWTTDGFFRETKAKVEYRKKEGCSVVEMECSALAACARMRGANFGQLLYTADSLSDAEHYDKRNWGSDSVEYALRLCIEAVLYMQEMRKRIW